MKHCFYFYFLNIYLFTCLGWVLVAAHEILRCSLWDPVSWPGTEHGPPALGARSLSHQITKEVPVCNFLNQYLLTFNNSFHQGLFSAALWLTHFLSGFVYFYMFTLWFLRCNIQFICGGLWRLGLTFDRQLAGHRTQVQSHSVSALGYQCSVNLSPPHLLLRMVVLSDLFLHEHWSPDHREAWSSSAHPCTADTSLECSHGPFVCSMEVCSDTHLVWSFYLKKHFFFSFKKHKRLLCWLMNHQYHQGKSISDTYNGIQPEIAKRTFRRIKLENLHHQILDLPLNWSEWSNRPATVHEVTKESDSTKQQQQ